MSLFDGFTYDHLPLLVNVAHRPDEVAVDDLRHRRSWGELWERGSRLAHALVDDLGVSPGDHVASMQGNNVEFYDLVIATMLSGTWLVPINTQLTSDEVSYVLRDSGAKVLFADDPRRAAAESPVECRTVGIGGELDALAERASGDPWPLTTPTGGRMHYTSGTTGRPKGVKRSLPATVASYLELLGRLGHSVRMDGHGPHLLTGPHYHAAVGGYALFDLVNGASIVMMPKFDASSVLQLITERRIAHTHLVPTMFVRLLRLADAERRAFDPTPLRTVLHGAAPISVVTKRAMIDWWGPRLVEYWGTSEAGTFTLIDSADWLTHPGSVGRPLPGVEVVVVDEAGQPLPAGAEGRLFCRSGDDPRPFRYHNAEAKTDEAYLAPGVYSLGDVGRVDEDGYVYLTDRATNMIVSGGVNVYPVEVEHALIEHPAVGDAAVFGVPDPEWGESVKAVVELRRGFVPSDELAAEIIAFLRERLAGYKTPRSVDFVELLPRLDSGKVKLQPLRDPYWLGRDRRIEGA